jgi:hypothetical protein
MKKTVFLLILAFALSCLRGAPAASQTKVYKLGVKMGLGNEWDAQNKSIIRDFAKVIDERKNVKIEIVWFLELDDLIAAVKKNELDFVYTPNLGNSLNLMANYGFEPFMVFELLGKKNWANCLFTNKNSPAGSIGDLRGMKGLLDYDFFTYATLRKLIGDRPETFFNPLKGSPNQFSSVYSVSMELEDAAYISELGIEFQRINNPGPIKKLKSLTCSEEHFIPSFLRSKKVPESIITDMQIIADLNRDEFRKDEMLKRYYTLFKTYKVKFARVTKKDYAPLLAIYKDAVKKGWLKDYEQWEKYAKDQK